MQAEQLATVDLSADRWERIKGPTEKDRGLPNELYRSATCRPSKYGPSSRMSRRRTGTSAKRPLPGAAAGKHELTLGKGNSMPASWIYKESPP